jgi:hypothetical protein
MSSAVVNVVARRRGQCLRFSRGVVAGGEVVTFAADVAAWPKDRGRLAEGKGQGVRLKPPKAKGKPK